MRHYVDCENCGKDFHIDEYEICFCDKCNNYVCNQCCEIDDNRNVINCDACEKQQLEESKNKIQDAKLQSLIDDVNELHKLCLKKHKYEVDITSNKIISWLEGIKSK
jgi:hypothetical protein